MSGPMSWRSHSKPVANPAASIAAIASYTQSSSWVSPEYRAGRRPTTANRRSHLQLNDARRRICPNSPFWALNFDLEQHRDDWKAGEERRRQAIADQAKTDRETHNLVGEPEVTTVSTRTPFMGILFPASPNALLDARGSVLGGEETIWCPQGADNDLSEWPSKHEMEYEGDGRLATDRLHRRCVPLPRLATKENWQHRIVIPQSFFDSYYNCVPKTEENPLQVPWEDVFIRMFRIEDLEFSSPSGEVDEEGKHALGSDLLAALDPQDQWV